jgi:hypothetical protein
MDSNITKGNKFWAGLLYVCSILVFLIGIRFGLIGGAIGGAVGYLLAQKARQINPMAGTKVNMDVNHGGLIALGALVLVIVIIWLSV